MIDIPIGRTPTGKRSFTMAYMPVDGPVRSPARAVIGHSSGSAERQQAPAADQKRVPRSRRTMSSAPNSASAAIVIDGLHAPVEPGIFAPSTT